MIPPSKELLLSLLHYECDLLNLHLLEFDQSNLRFKETTTDTDWEAIGQAESLMLITSKSPVLFLHMSKNLFFLRQKKIRGIKKTKVVVDVQRLVLGIDFNVELLDALLLIGNVEEFNLKQIGWKPITVRFFVDARM
jgi:hypothetical protein